MANLADTKRRLLVSNFLRLRAWFVGLPWLQLAELGVIGLWSLWVARNYLDFDTSVWPAGNEWGLHLTPYYFWMHLRECGLCALWNGDIGGGMPAIGSWFAGTLHPLAAVFTLLFGVTNGIKLAVIAAFWLAGAAQWWMASSLRVGRIARLWSSMMVVVGGHLVVVMEFGDASLIIAAASASLVLAAALALSIHGQRKNTLFLAMLGAFFILAGYPYMQFGMLWWLLALPFLVLDEDFRLKPIWKEFALALGLSVCLASIFLIPSLNFAPNFFRPGDGTFSYGQPLEYLPFNLVINDPAFFHAEILGKLPFTPPMFIGWVPIILAFVCLKVIRPRDYRVLLFLASGTVLMLFLASGTPLRWLVEYIPDLANYQNVFIFSGLAVPGILALAAYGLHHLQQSISPYKIFLNFGSPTNNQDRASGINMAWLLIPFLAWALFISYQFSQDFLKVQNYQDYYDAVKQIPKPDGLQWIQLPYAEIPWLPVGIDAGFKQTVPPVPYTWKDRTQPEGKLFLARLDSLAGTENLGPISGINLFRNPIGEYARVELPDGQQMPCKASGQGGNLDIVCDVASAGRLVVEENTISNWKVWRDNVQVSLLNTNQWLSADAPAGRHTYRFRYLPWDVTVGALVSLASLVVWLLLWRKRYESQLPDDNAHLKSDTDNNI
jgi:hypothetical protein